MQAMMPFIIGILYTAALYMMMRRSLVKLVIGLVLLSHASHLLIFTVGRLTPGRPPLIPTGGGLGPDDAIADPLPQALILTAIVIGFGVQAFALVLIKRVYLTLGTEDLDSMKSTDT